MDVVKGNFSTSDGPAREPGLKGAIAESSSPKNHSSMLSSLATQSCSLRSILCPVKGKVLNLDVLTEAPSGVAVRLK